MKEISVDEKTQNIHLKFNNMKKSIIFSINRWKTTALFMLLTSLLLNTYQAKAQLNDFTCFIEEEPLDSAAKMAFVSSTFGNIFTPKGELRILLIFAGFTNDGNTQSSNVNWPYDDGIRPPGKSFPTNMNDYFYTNANQFSLANTDNSISNYYYQMSYPSGNPFKIIADVFPERINVTADIVTDTIWAWSRYNQWIMDSIAVKYPNFDFSPYDNRKNSPSYAFDNTNTGTYPRDNKIDYTVIVWRYGQKCNEDPNYIDPNTNAPYPKTLCNHGWSSGAVASVPGKTFTNSLGTSYSTSGGFTFFKGFNGLDKTTFTHELGHSLYDSPHYNGANGIVGTHFYGNYGWGMMRSPAAAHVYDCANGWERWYNGWIELTANNNTVASEINSIADIQNGGVYTLHDFIATGDVIRVKLPKVSNQFLWLENHTGASKYDDREGWDLNMLGGTIPTAPRGLVAYIENINQNRTTAMYNLDSKWNLGTNGIKYLNANGNFDYSNQYASPEPTAPEVWYDIAYDFIKANINPLGSHTPTTLVRNDFYGNVTEIHYDNYNNSCYAQYNCFKNEQRTVYKEDGNFTYGALGIGMNFPQGAKVDMGSNPMIANLQMYDQGNSALDTVFLNGISFEVLSYNTDSSVTVKIRMDDYEVRDTTRYTGEIALSPNVVSSANYSLDLAYRVKLDIDKSGTPNRHTITGDNDFINPTRFTCLSGSYFHLSGKATVNVINGSTLRLMTGSKMELDTGATLRIGAGSTLIIENGAELKLKPDAYMIIDSGATVIYKNSTTNKGLLVGETTVTAIPARVEVSGNITFMAGAIWAHNRDGFYRFHPTNSLFFQYPSSIKFTGKSKTRKMVELANNTTLTLNNVDDADWNTGLIYYGSNSKVVLNNTNFTSIACTYNPASNPQTTSTAVKLIEPQATFFNSCDFNKLGKGVVVNGGTSLVHIQQGKFTNMTTYGVELTDVANFKMTNGFIDGAATCLYAENSNVVEINGTELKNAMYGAELYQVAGAYFSSSANIHNHAVGIKASMSLVFLRNGAQVHNNSQYGVEIYGSYDSGLGNYNAMLTMGDIGCGSVYNNQNYGIFGVDALLNIDAVQHSIDRGDNIIRPNRFDNNAYKTFEICYGSSTVAPSQINAKGNFWGVSPADIQPSQYDFIANACLSRGGTPVYIPLIHTDYSTCVPTNTCMDCSSGGGGGGSSSSSSSSLAVQTSFSDANIKFVEEDNTTTRNEFTNLSAIELIKDTVLDTWKGKSVNDVLFSLEKESVHLIQVSKAIKARANNSTGRLMNIVEDVFKDVSPENIGSVSTVSLYPNPANDKLFVDVEKEGNYTLIIYNISGQKVVEQTLIDKHNLVNVNKLPDGMYFYELSAPNSNTVKGNITITK
jgi:hypothetical protein